MTVLLFYSTTDGQTLKIAKKIAQGFSKTVEIRPIDELSEKSIKRDDIELVIIGAAIRYGHFNKQLVNQLKRYSSCLNLLPTAFYSVCLTARKPGRDNPADNFQIQKLIKKTAWQPNKKAVFAGQLNYPNYRFFDRQMIRFIMKLTGGCSDGKSTIEYTDWDKVDHFARLLSKEASDCENSSIVIAC